VDVNVPGVMAILLAPVVAQLSVLLAPESMLVGAAVKEEIAGGESGPVGGFNDVTEPQPASPKHANKISAIEHPCSHGALGSPELNPILQNELADFKGSPLAVGYDPILASAVFYTVRASQTKVLQGITFVMGTVVGQQWALNGFSTRSAKWILKRPACFGSKLASCLFQIVIYSRSISGAMPALSYRIAQPRSIYSTLPLEY